MARITLQSLLVLLTLFSLAFSETAKPKGVALNKDSKCDVGLFQSKTDKLCYPCHKSCQSCDGPTKNECLSCQRGMYIVIKEGANKCVSDCTSVGLYLDDKLGGCVGCHPACNGCFGPSNDECIDCEDGFLQMGDTNTCDTECSPINSFVANETVCVPCHKKCASCFGPNIFECRTCFWPYSIKPQTTECEFNVTLAAENRNFKIPMTMFEKINLVLTVMLSILGAFILWKVVWYIIVEWQAGRDRSYNLFDKAELNS
jgi:hypothetical protein